MALFFSRSTYHKWLVGKKRLALDKEMVCGANLNTGNTNKEQKKQPFQVLWAWNTTETVKGRSFFYPLQRLIEHLVSKIQFNQSSMFKLGKKERDLTAFKVILKHIPKYV